MLNKSNWIGLDGKEKENGYSPSPRPTPTSLFSSYNIIRFTPNQCGIQSKGLVFKTHTPTPATGSNSNIPHTTTNPMTKLILNKMATTN